MKGKAEFTAAEAAEIEKLIEHKLRASTNEQKGIRDKIRKLGFYASDFGIRGGYNVTDFRRVRRIIGMNPGSIVTPAIPLNLPTDTEIVKPNLNSLSTAISLDHAQDILPQLRALGFKGYVAIKDIRQDYTLLPKVGGIYILLRADKEYKFREVGSGGHFKGKNPNVSLTELQSNWVDDSRIIYIGKAGSTKNSATIQSRLKQYFRFGQGKAIGHWGGRFIWQLEQPEELLVCWKEIKESEPAEMETYLIQEFTKYYGKRPFANLKD